MGYRILVVGKGGREHAICWKLAQSEMVDELICAPGNAGIEAVAECVTVQPMDIPGMVTMAQNRHIDLVVIGPEDPLAAGMADAMEAAGILCAGPSQQAAMLESSKSFANEVMAAAKVPTARSHTITTREEGISAISDLANEHGVVVKADGLAAGKGVVVADSVEEATQALDDMLLRDSMGDAGHTIVIEERLVGPEVSILCLTDGKTIIPLQPSCDYKRAFDGDQGPNTGGMGNYTPTQFADDAMMQRIQTEILQPTIDEMARRGMPMKGVLFAGLMICDDGPKVIEFNCRFGDPETQVVLPTLNDDLAVLMHAVATGTLDQQPSPKSTGAAVGVVLASAGYPEDYRKGIPITFEPESAQYLVFHAGTRRDGDAIVTDGGRVLCVVGQGETVAEARDTAYTGINLIRFAGSWIRHDIALRESGPD